MSEYSLSDVAAAAGGEGFGGNSAWVLIILFALIFGWGRNGFGGANSEMPVNVATSADVQRATDFAALERQNNEGVAATRQVGYDLQSAIKDSAYNSLSELRQIQASTQAGFANMQNCCCETQRAIDGVNYNAAMNTASINANTTEQTQKILDAICANKIGDLQAQVQALQGQLNMAGVVRYPNSWTYNAGASPFCGGFAPANI